MDSSSRGSVVRVKRMSKEYEEVKRRALVAAAKAAGTLIRKEELRRQAITARVNLPIAQSLLNEINDLLEKVPDVEVEIKKATETALKEGKPVLDTAVTRGIDLIIESIPLVFTDTPSRMLNAAKDVNSLIEVTNNIIKDLAKEGISIPTLSLIDIKGNDLVSLSFALRIGKQRLITIISFLQELEKYELTK